MTTPSKDAAETPAPMSAKTLRQEAQKLNGLALETLGSIMRGTGQDAVKLAAAREVLDRAHGKPRAAGSKSRAPKPPAKRGMTVIVKRFSDVTAEEQAAADATEREEW
ncbi:MAG TPA: hypothetical protein VIE16_06385 [Phenylobacterium sp.]|jgi:hypothetical protein